MRHARLLPLALLSVALVAACASAPPGWTYAPAPSTTPAPAGSGAPASGAPASGAPASGAPASGAPAGSGALVVVKIEASGIAYVETSATAPASTPFQIRFTNSDAGTAHNVSIHSGGPTGPELFKGEIFPGVATKTYDVPALDPGSYSYVCTVHPTMVGTLTVQ